jgi:hypothetical protein
MLVFGLAMIVMVIVRPQGLLPLRLLRFRRAHLPRGEPPAAAPAATPEVAP